MFFHTNSSLLLSLKIFLHIWTKWHALARTEALCSIHYYRVCINQRREPVYSSFKETIIFKCPTLSRSPYLWPTRFNDEQCDQMVEFNSPILHKSCPKSRHCIFWINHDIFKYPQNSTDIWATFVCKFVKRSFKNSPIWSQWRQVLAWLGHFDTWAAFHKTICLQYLSVCHRENFAKFRNGHIGPAGIGVCH